MKFQHRKSGFRAKRWIASVTLVTFIASQNTLFGAPVAGIQAGDFFPDMEISYENLVNRIVIPQEFGSIRERFAAQPSVSGNPSPIVVHVQDAHANYEAQKNIEAIIEYLNREYGFKLLVLEGGAGKLDPAKLQVFKKRELNDELLEGLMKKGEVTGSEAYLVSHAYEPSGAKEKVDAYGIESADAYRRDLEHFRNIWQDTERGRTFASELALLIDRAGSRIMNRDLRAFLKEWQRYKETKAHLLSYLNVIQNEARGVLGIDLTDARNQREWPILLRMFKLKEMEPRLNLRNAKAEWRKAKTFFENVEVDSVLIEEVENRLYGKEASETGGTESLRNLLERILETAYPKGFRFKDYPELSLWVGSTLLRSEIDGDEIFEEIDRLNNMILQKLAETTDEKRVVELFRQSYLLNDLFALELSRDNFLKIRSGAELFSPREVVARIAKLDPTTIYGSEGELRALDAIYRECLKSYEFALTRESAFFKNLKEVFRDTKRDRAITVAGGFHTSGFTEGFKNLNVSYLIVSPRITVFQDVEKEQQNYVRSLLQPIPTSASTSLRVAPLYTSSEDVGAIKPYQLAQVRGTSNEVVQAHGIDWNSGGDLLEPPWAEAFGLEQSSTANVPAVPLSTSQSPSAADVPGRAVATGGVIIQTGAIDRSLRDKLSGTKVAPVEAVGKPEPPLSHARKQVIAGGTKSRRHGLATTSFKVLLSINVLFGALASAGCQFANTITAPIASLYTNLFPTRLGEVTASDGRELPITVHAQGYAGGKVHRHVSHWTDGTTRHVTINFDFTYGGAGGFIFTDVNLDNSWTPLANGDQALVMDCDIFDENGNYDPWTRPVVKVQIINSQLNSEREAAEAAGDQYALGNIAFRTPTFYFLFDGSTGNGATFVIPMSVVRQYYPAFDISGPGTIAVTIETGSSVDEFNAQFDFVARAATLAGMSVSLESVIQALGQEVYEAFLNAQMPQALRKGKLRIRIGEGNIVSSRWEDLVPIPDATDENVVPFDTMVPAGGTFTLIEPTANGQVNHTILAPLQNQGSGFLLQPGVNRQHWPFDLRVGADTANNWASAGVVWSIDMPQMPVVLHFRNGAIINAEGSVEFAVWLEAGTKWFKREFVQGRNGVSTNGTVTDWAAQTANIIYEVPEASQGVSQWYRGEVTANDLLELGTSTNGFRFFSQPMDIPSQGDYSTNNFIQWSAELMSVDWSSVPDGTGLVGTAWTPIGTYVLRSELRSLAARFINLKTVFTGFLSAIIGWAGCGVSNPTPQAPIPGYIQPGTQFIYTSIMPGIDTTKLGGSGEVSPVGGQAPQLLPDGSYQTVASPGENESSILIKNPVDLVMAFRPSSGRIVVKITDKSSTPVVKDFAILIDLDEVTIDFKKLLKDIAEDPAYDGLLIPRIADQIVVEHLGDSLRFNAGPQVTVATASAPATVLELGDYPGVPSADLSALKIIHTGGGNIELMDGRVVLKVPEEQTQGSPNDGLSAEVVLESSDGGPIDLTGSAYAGKTLFDGLEDLLLPGVVNFVRIHVRDANGNGTYGEIVARIKDATGKRLLVNDLVQELNNRGIDATKVQAISIVFVMGSSVNLLNEDGVSVRTPQLSDRSRGIEFAVGVDGALPIVNLDIELAAAPDPLDPSFDFAGNDADGFGGEFGLTPMPGVRSYGPETISVGEAVAVGIKKVPGKPALRYQKFGVFVPEGNHVVSLLVKFKQTGQTAIYTLRDPLISVNRQYGGWLIVDGAEVWAALSAAGFSNVSDIEGIYVVLPPMLPGDSVDKHKLLLSGSHFGNLANELAMASGDVFATPPNLHNLSGTVSHISTTPGSAIAVDIARYNGPLDAKITATITAGTGGLEFNMPENSARSGGFQIGIRAGRDTGADNVDLLSVPVIVNLFNPTTGESYLYLVTNQGIRENEPTAGLPNMMVATFQPADFPPGFLEGDLVLQVLINDETLALAATGVPASDLNPLIVQVLAAESQQTVPTSFAVAGGIVPLKGVAELVSVGHRVPVRISVPASKLLMLNGVLAEVIPRVMSREEYEQVAVLSRAHRRAGADFDREFGLARSELRSRYSGGRAAPTVSSRPSSSSLSVSAVRVVPQGVTEGTAAGNSNRFELTPQNSEIAVPANATSVTISVRETRDREGARVVIVPGKNGWTHQNRALPTGTLPTSEFGVLRGLIVFDHSPEGRLVIKRLVNGSERSVAVEINFGSQIPSEIDLEVLSDANRTALESLEKALAIVEQSEGSLDGVFAEIDVDQAVVIRKLRETIAAIGEAKDGAIVNNFGWVREHLLPFGEPIQQIAPGLMKNLQEADQLLPKRRRSELRIAPTAELSMAEKEVAELAGKLLPVSWIRVGRNGLLPAWFGQLGMPLAFAGEGVVTRAALEQVEGGKLLVAVAPEVFLRTLDGEVNGQVIRVLTDVPATIAALKHDVVLAAVRPNEFRLDVYFEKVSGGEEVLKAFERQLLDYFKQVRTDLGLNPDIAAPISVTPSLPAKGLNSLLPKRSDPRFDHVVMITENRSNLRGVQAGAGSYLIYDDTVASDAKLALSLLAERLALGLERNASRFKAGIQTASQIIVDILKAVKDAAQHIAIAA